MNSLPTECHLSLRRWSSRRFPYGYLVTTSPQSSTTPWWTLPWRLSYPLLVQSTPMVWRAVCTRPGTYSPRHSDPRLLAIPTSWSRVADSIRTTTVLRFASHRCVATLCTYHCSVCVALVVRRHDDLTSSPPSSSLSRQYRSSPTAGKLRTRVALVAGLNPTSHDTSHDSHAAPVTGPEGTPSLERFLLCQDQVRFFALHRIKPCSTACAGPVNSFEF